MGAEGELFHFVGPSLSTSGLILTTIVAGTVEAQHQSLASPATADMIRQCENRSRDDATHEKDQRNLPWTSSATHPSSRCLPPKAAGGEPLNLIWFRDTSFAFPLFCPSLVAVPVAVLPTLLHHSDATHRLWLGTRRPHVAGEHVLAVLGNVLLVRRLSLGQGQLARDEVVCGMTILLLPEVGAASTSFLGGFTRHSVFRLCTSTSSEVESFPHVC